MARAYVKAAAAAPRDQPEARGETRSCAAEEAFRDPSENDTNAGMRCWTARSTTHSVRPVDAEVHLNG